MSTARLVACRCIVCGLEEMRSHEGWTIDTDAEGTAVRMTEIPFISVPETIYVWRSDGRAVSSCGAHEHDDVIQAWRLIGDLVRVVETASL